MQIKKNDAVIVIAGKDKGKTGSVSSVDLSAGKVVIDGVNMVSKTVKPRNAQQKGGITKKPAALDASNVMLVCPSCGKATRVSVKIENKDGKDVKVRVCKKCGTSIEVTAAKAKATAKKVAKKTATKKTAAKKTEKSENKEA